MEKCYTSYTIDEFYDKILEKSDSYNKGYNDSCYVLRKKELNDDMDL